MTTFPPKHILVPVAVGYSDDPTIAEQLVHAAVCLARQSGDAALLTLLYVDASQPLFFADAGFAPAAYYQGLASVQESNRAAARDSLTALAKRTAAQGVKTETLLVSPVVNAGAAIADAAVERHADLIMVMSHSRRGLDRFLLGSVAERVAHLAHVPVLILRLPHEEEGAGKQTPAITA